MEKVKYCIACGAKHNHSSNLCQRCYRYSHQGGVIHPLPKAGEVAYDEEGKPICHICGKSFTNLSFHIRGAHNMSPVDYRYQFKLAKGTRLVSEELSNKHKQNYYKLIRKEE